MNTFIRINCETLSLVFMSEKLSLGKRALFFFRTPLPAESTAARHYIGQSKPLPLPFPFLPLAKATPGPHCLPT